MLADVYVVASNWAGHITEGLEKIQSEPDKFGHAAGLVLRGAAIWACQNGLSASPLEPLSHVVDKFGNLKDVVQFISSPIDFVLDFSLDSTDKVLTTVRNLSLITVGAAGTLMWLADLGFETPGVIAASMGREVQIFGKVVAFSVGKVLYGAVLVTYLCEGLRHAYIITHSTDQEERTASCLKAAKCGFEVLIAGLLIGAVCSSGGTAILALEGVTFGLSMAESAYSIGWPKGSKA